MKKYIYTCDKCGKDITDLGSDVEIQISKADEYHEIPRVVREIQLCLKCYGIFDSWIKAEAIKGVER